MLITKVTVFLEALVDDVADLVDSEPFGQHLVGNAIAPECFERARKDGAGLGIAREVGVLFEQFKGQAVEMQPERGGQSDRPGADHEDRFVCHRVNRPAPERQSRG